MRIVAPLSRLEETTALASAGAGELYCSAVPPDWIERFGSGAVGRRPFANLPDYADLGRVVEIAARLEVRISLALNAQHYSGEQVERLVALAAEFAALGGSAVIASDPALVAALGEAATGLEVQVSSVASCHNRAALAFWAGLGARRVILPRQVTLAEVAAMAAACPGLELEAFVLNDGCIYEEGVCHTIHLPGALGGPICLDRYRSGYRHADGAALDGDEQALLEGNERDYRRWVWGQTSCGFTVTEEGYPWGPCGLCAIPALARAGVAAVKIAGREASAERKVKSVEMVRAVLDRWHESGEEAGTQACARALRRRPDLCAEGCLCYYPEVRGE